MASKEGKSRLMAGKEIDSMRLPDSTRIGAPVLRVKDLDRMLDFYTGNLGLEARRSVRRIGDEEIGKGKDSSSDLNVELGFGDRAVVTDDTADPLLILQQDPSAKEMPHDFAGLYHFAILVPDRKSLAQAYLGVQARGEVYLEGYADHLVSESLYLHDPEHNGIEIYRDRPRDEWTRDNKGRIMMDTLPLDIGGVLGELSQQEKSKVSGPFPSGARIGHMHLRVTDLERSTKFYHEKLGFDISSDWSAMGAMFLSAGGYHHHIGLNTWHSLEGSPHEVGQAGLDSLTLELPHDTHFESELKSQLGDAVLGEHDNRELLVSDPDGIRIKIKWAHKVGSLT